MNKKKILTINVFIFVILISLIFGFTSRIITTFSGDPFPNGTMNFVEERSIFKSISLPSGVIITKAEIDLTGTRLNKLIVNNSGIREIDTFPFNDKIHGSQSFMVGDGEDNSSFVPTIISMNLQLDNAGATPIIFFAIKNATLTGEPTGADIINQSFNQTINHSSIPVEQGFRWFNFTLNTTTFLPTDRNYTLVIRTSDEDAGLDNTRSGKRPSYPNGNFFFSTDFGASWTGNTDKDLQFRIYGQNHSVTSSVTIATNKELAYHNVSNFNGTVRDIDLNISSLQKCVNSFSSGNATCIINFTTATPGTIEYLNLEIGYTQELNITFRDEVSNALIEGETFTIILTKTGFLESQSTTNSSININLDTGTYNIDISSANYLSREYQKTILESRNSLTAYLINSTLGSQKTFNIVDEALNPLDNVRVVFTKIIDGSDVIISEIDSDFAGHVVLDLNSNTEYTINFSKTNFEDQEITLRPVDSEYVITMISTVGKYNQSVHEGIRYRFEPSDIVLNNNTKYNFTFTLNSTVWPVTNCTLKLFNGTTLLINESSFTSTSCHISVEQNTFDMTNITLEGIYELSSEFEFTVSQQYSVIDTYEGQFSLKNFLDDISEFGMAGFDNFGRMILAFVVIFVILILAGQNIGFENREVLLFIFWALVGFFSFVGWFTLGLETMPSGLGLKKYFIFYLISLICGGFVINKFRK